MARPDPMLLAKGFLDHYKLVFGEAGAPKLPTLYGPDSVLCFDANVAKSRDPIVGGLKAAVLAGGPIQIKWTARFGASFTPANTIMLLTTGERPAPNQLFAQLFVLAPIPGGAGGGMYVKVDAFRSVAAGAGRAALNDQDPSGMGKGFVEQYYKVYAAGRAGLAGLYRPHSVLVVEGQRYEGRDAIMQKLTMTENRVEKDKVVDKPMASGQHKMGTLDAVQLPDCVVVLVTGMMLLHGETNAIAFAQAFQLMRDASGPYVSNEVFMFNYAG